MVVRARLRGALLHETPNAKETLERAVAEEGGPLQVICGWCDSDDLEIVSLKPVPETSDALNARFAGRERGDDYGELMPRTNENDICAKPINDVDRCERRKGHAGLCGLDPI